MTDSVSILQITRNEVHRFNRVVVLTLFLGYLIFTGLICSFGLEKKIERFKAYVEPIKTSITQSLFVENVFKISSLARELSQTEENNIDVTVFNVNGSLLAGKNSATAEIPYGLSMQLLDLKISYKALLEAGGIQLGTLVIRENALDRNFILTLVILWATLFILGWQLYRLASRLTGIYQNRLVQPIISLHNNLQGGFQNLHTTESEPLVHELVEIKESLQLAQIKMTKLLDLELKSKLAAQVAHDIRSPLSALNMVLGTINDFPEEKRLIMRGAVQRINDIANGLLKQGKEKSGDPKSSPSSIEQVMLVAFLDGIVSEKRTQYRDKINVEIEGNLAKGYGLFARINSAELSRVISNLVNNSVEAFENASGKIIVGIQRVEDNNTNEIAITIEDNGKGIPPHVLAKLGERGFTHGKAGTESGSGLGIAHARETFETAGGDIKISSSVGIGTKITLTLPSCDMPSWFVERLQVHSKQLLVTVDDDQSIHQIWSGRIASALPPNEAPRHFKFTSIEEFELWAQENHCPENQYLIDYEFLDQGRNGIETIERLQIQNQAILVTSRFEEPQIQAKGRSLKLKMIPKSLAPLVPIEIKKLKAKYDAILIDDDTLIHMAWQMAARENVKQLLCFSNPEEFFAQSSEFDLESPIMIDVSLACGVRGEEVAKKALALGFKNAFLTTGYEPDSIVKPEGLNSVVGKDPMFPI